MMYLVSKSRPGITFAVHQCAMFDHGTKYSQEKAILQLCRYLKGTQPEGLIIKPNMKDMLQVNCFADAVFAGLFFVKDLQDVSLVRSRTGYVMTFAGCPILWVSKLQTEVALSTLYAEYVALFQSLRDLLSTKDLITEVVKGMWQKDTHMELKLVSKSTVYEENNGAIRVASCPKTNPTSKSIAVKYHWFRQHVESSEVDIFK
eukprot:14819393-Ditylum_brightwellii.AAC.1